MDAKNTKIKILIDFFKKPMIKNFHFNNLSKKNIIKALENCTEEFFHKKSFAIVAIIVLLLFGSPKVFSTFVGVLVFVIGWSLKILVNSLYNYQLMQEPSADKEPSAQKEPSADKEPSAQKEPSADKEPSANKELSSDHKDPGLTALFKVIFSTVKCPNCLSQLIILGSMVIISSSLVVFLCYLGLIIPLYFSVISSLELKKNQSIEAFKAIPNLDNVPKIIPTKAIDVSYFKHLGDNNYYYVFSSAKSYSCIVITFLVIVLQVIIG